MCLTLLIGLGCGESAFGSAEATTDSTAIEEVKVLRVGSSPHMAWDSSYDWYSKGTYAQELASVGLQLKDVIHVTRAKDKLPKPASDDYNGNYIHRSVEPDFCLGPTLTRDCLHMLFDTPPPSQSDSKENISLYRDLAKSHFKSGFFDIIISDRSTLSYWPLAGYPRLLKVGGICIATDLTRCKQATRENPQHLITPFESVPSGVQSMSDHIVQRKLKVTKFLSFAEFERAYASHKHFAKIKKLYQLGHKPYKSGDYDPNAYQGIAVIERLPDDPEPEAIKQPEPAMQPAPVVQPAPVM